MGKSADTTSFDRRFERALDVGLATTDAYEASLATIRRSAALIERWFRTRKKAVTVTVEPGYLVNAGQQLNVTVRIPSQHVADTLFRAYLALDGTVSFDFYGEDLVVCATPEETEKAVLDFVARPEVQLRLRTCRDLATGKG